MRSDESNWATSSSYSSASSDSIAPEEEDALQGDAAWGTERAEDDDDEILSELLTDLMVGVAVSACETNAMCSAFMTIVTIAFIIISLIGFCINGCRCDDEYRPSRKSFRRAGTGVIGYGIGRALFH